jgi:hypothetical protein
VGKPEKIEWYAEGRRATREDIMYSIDTGLPLLMAEAKKDGQEGVDELNQLVKEAMLYVPNG